jgi:16S rRNA (guanine966-N2)-methyltransferase|tara:strand:- start:2628 stop:3206 length:579 start_codon:yes stop_codon:yes gene_type:complete
MGTGLVTTRISGGVHKGRLVRTPRSAGLRPTSERVRAAVFSIIGAGSVTGKKVLDLYAGTGAFGIDALSRGASSADFVEHNHVLCTAIRGHLRELSLDSIGKVHRSKVHRMLPNMKGAFDLVIADPPYDSDEFDTVLDELQRPGLIADNGIVVLEYRTDADSIKNVGGFRRLTDRTYGDTAITILEAGDANA